MKVYFAEHNQVVDETVSHFDARASLSNSGERVKRLKDGPAENPNQEQSESNVPIADVTPFGADAGVEGFEQVVLDAPAQVSKLAQFGRKESRIGGEDPKGLRLSGVVALEGDFADAGDVERKFQFVPRHTANSPDLVFDVADGVDTFGDHDSRILGIRFRVDVRKEILGPNDRFQTNIFGFGDQVHFPEGNRVAKVNAFGHDAVVEEVSGERFAHGLNRPPHHPARCRQFGSSFAHRFDVKTEGEFVSNADQGAGEKVTESAPVRDAGPTGSAGRKMERQASFRSRLGMDCRRGAAKHVQVPSFKRSTQRRIGDNRLSPAGEDFPERREAQSLIQRQKTAATSRHLENEHLEDRGSRNHHVLSSDVLLAIGPKGDLEKSLGEMFKRLQLILLSPPWPLLLAYFNKFSKIFDFFRSGAGETFFFSAVHRDGEVVGPLHFGLTGVRPQNSIG